MGFDCKTFSFVILPLLCYWHEHLVTNTLGVPERHWRQKNVIHTVVVISGPWIESAYVSCVRTVVRIVSPAIAPASDYHNCLLGRVLFGILSRIVRRCGNSEWKACIWL